MKKYSIGALALITIYLGHINSRVAKNDEMLYSSLICAYYNSFANRKRGQFSLMMNISNYKSIYLKSQIGEGNQNSGNHKHALGSSGFQLPFFFF